jgi:hypothetical protein
MDGLEYLPDHCRYPQDIYNVRSGGLLLFLPIYQQQQQTSSVVRLVHRERNNTMYFKEYLQDECRYSCSSLCFLVDVYLIIVGWRLHNDAKADI